MRVASNPPLMCVHSTPPIQGKTAAKIMPGCYAGLGPRSGLDCRHGWSRGHLPTHDNSLRTPAWRIIGSTSVVGCGHSNSEATGNNGVCTMAIAYGIGIPR